MKTVNNPSFFDIFKSLKPLEGADDGDSGEEDKVED